MGEEIMVYDIEIEQYCSDLIKMGRKKRTTTTYASNLRTCIGILEEGKKNFLMEDIDEDDLYYLIDHLDTTEPTKKAMLMVLNGMIRHFTGRDIVHRMNILWNRVVRHRCFITKGDFAAMYRIADPRERMILVMGAFMGLRRNEITQICIGDIRRSCIIVHGKGHGTDGFVVEQFMPDEVQSEIETYLTWRNSLNYRDLSGGRLIVFFDNKKREMRSYENNSSRISDIIKDLGNRAGIEATTHSLRRLFCTTLYYDQECDICTLKDLMRHANINTTLTCYVDSYNVNRNIVVEKMVKGFGQVLNNDESNAKELFESSG